MSTENEYLEIETKYSADDIDRLQFKELVDSFNPKSFLYIEGKDVYYVKGENDFLRYRMAVEHIESDRAELTFKKKKTDKNNNVRLEVNLRVDLNDPLLVNAFCEGLGFKRNFSLSKLADIYFFNDANIVYYIVKTDKGEKATFIEIEAAEDGSLTPEQAWEVVQKYEKLLAPLGISAQKRKRLSLFEMFVKYEIPS